MGSCGPAWLGPAWPAWDALAQHGHSISHPWNGHGNGPFPIAMITWCAWSSTIQLGPAWHGHGSAVWAWSHMAWLGPAQHGAACLSMAWPSMAQDGSFSCTSPGSCIPWPHAWTGAGYRRFWQGPGACGARGLRMVLWGKWRSLARDKASVAHTFISISRGHNVANPHSPPHKPLVQSDWVAMAPQPSHAGTPVWRGASGPDLDTAGESLVGAWVKTRLRVPKRVPRPWLRGL